MRLLTVDRTIIELECGEKIHFPCKIMIAIMNLDNFEFKEFNFENCQLIRKSTDELTNHFTVSLSEDEWQLEPLHNLLLKLDGTENIFGETRKAQNTTLMEKKPQILHYPYLKDMEYYESFEQQRKEIFATIKEDLIIPENVELDFVVSEFKYYDKILQSGYTETFRNYIQEMNLGNSSLLSKKLSRVHIGNDFCNQLFPKDTLLKKLLLQAYKEKLEITISYPVIIQRNLPSITKSIALINEFCLEKGVQVELAINDYGMLFLLKEGNFSAIKPVLGRLLNKRKKDPRIKYRLSYETYKEKLGINNLNGEQYLNFLRNNNVDRFEFETCGFLNEIPDGHHTLHFPFYQISTATNCLLYANCKNGSVARQELPVNCPHYCNEFHFSYAKHLDMINKNNSIFGVDREFLSSQKIIDYYAKAGIDRFAFTPL